MKAVLGLLFFPILAVLGNSKFQRGQWVMVGSKYYSFNADKKSYSAALASCISEGGQLFEPRDELTNLNIYNEALERGIVSVPLPDYTTPGFWFGINDIDQENHFVYTSHEAQPLNWTNWSPNLPDNLGGNEDCGEIGRISNDKWNDLDCSNELTYVCQMDDPLPPSSGLLMLENCEDKYPCEEISQDGIFPNVKLCQQSCNVDKQCASWKFENTGEPNNCHKYTCPSKSQLDNCAVIIAPKDVDIDQYKEELQPNFDDQDFSAAQSCYVFQHSLCQLDKEKKIISLPGEYEDWRVCKGFCDEWPGCQFYRFRFSTCDLYSGNPKVQCQDTIGPKNSYNLTKDGECDRPEENIVLYNLF